MIANAVCGVVELRRYAMRPGRRDDLIGLFERRFIEAQEGFGALPVGHYRDLDDADSFVWFRGFTSMETRSGALERFYTSRTWTDNRDAANATLVDSDDVLLLRSARPDSGFDLDGLTRPADADSAAERESFVAVSIFMLKERVGEDLLAAFEARMLPEMRRSSARTAYFVTEERPNDFPRLPVREHEFALVAIGVCKSGAELDAWSQIDERRLPDTLRSNILSSETLRLQPGRRSLFR